VTTFGLKKALLSLILIPLLILTFFIPVQFVNAFDTIINTETIFPGQINGVMIAGIGTGTLNHTTNSSTNDVTFTSFPIDTFNPYYGKSWKCKHHHKLLSVINNLSNYFTETTITYSKDATGTIYTAGTVTKTENGTKSVADTIWSGTYLGPIETGIDIEFYEIYTPTQNPKQISFSGHREIRAPNNKTIYCNWTGIISSTEDIELCNTYVFTYSWSNVSWNTITKEFHKEVHIDIEGG